MRAVRVLLFVLIICATGSVCVLIGVHLGLDLLHH